MPQMPCEVKSVCSKEWVDFKCQMCGRCCRDLENTVMVESLDAYRIAYYLRKHGHSNMEMATFYEQYTSPIMLVEGYPIMMMNTTGEDHSCVFLKDGRCSIYESRPRTCRQYPFTVAPGNRGRDFEWFLCLDRPFHLTGGKVLVKDWIYQNFSNEEKEYLRREYEFSVQIGKALRRLDQSLREQSLKDIFFLRYIFFELDEPFLPQYDRNMKELLQRLRQQKGAGGDGKTGCA